VSVTTQRLVVCRLDADGIGQELCGFRNPRLLKPIKESLRCDNKRRLRVAFGKRVVLTIELGVDKECHDPTAQARQQQLYEVRRIRKAQQDAVPSRKAAALEHFPETCATVVDFTMGHDVRPMVGRLVTPSRL
jgi:hypothetical protein